MVRPAPGGGYRKQWLPQLRKHFELAKAAGIERALFTSSLSTIGLAKRGESLPKSPAL